MKRIRHNNQGRKKWLRGVLALFMVPLLLFAGCADTEEASDKEMISGGTVPDKEMVSDGGTVPDKESLPQSVSSAVRRGTPVLSVQTITRTRYYGGEALNIKYDELSLSGDGFETAAQAVSEWNRRDIQQIENLQDCMGDTHELSSTVECVRMDGSVISFTQRWHEADGLTDYRGINFDVESGKQLLLADILTDEEGFAARAAEIAVEKLRERSEAGQLPSGYENDVIYEFANGIVDAENNWCLDACGIVYAYNHLTATIPYGDVAEYMKAAYCGIQGAGVARFSVNEAVCVNLSDQRMTENAFREESAGDRLAVWDALMITTAEGNTEGEWKPVCITINERTETFETEAAMQDAYLLCQESGSIYLLFDTALADHDFTTYLYDITDGGITKKEELEFTWLMQPINVNAIKLLDIIDVFGTYFGYATYRINESTGKLEAPELHYTDAENSDTTLTLVEDLPVIMHGEETVLPPGTPIQITAVSDSGTARFCELVYGEEGEFYYAIDENGTVRIDGLEESFYFESLPYSG